MAMFVEVGKVKVTNCVFSLKYLVKSCKMMIPGICVDKDGTLNLNTSEIKGNERKDTIGIICKLGTVHVSNCSVTDHREGGILTWGGKENTSKVIGSKIERNSVGIHVMGSQYKLKICQNNINGNKLGIKVGLACEVEISRNSIC
jgi:nitrous oxidase accessory protein NosD